MPVITTKPAGQIVAANAQARRQAEAADARRAAKQALDEQQAKKADTTTPIVGAVPLETIPEPMPSIEKAARKISVSTTVEHRGRSFTITAEGVTLDQFCDLLDARGYIAQAQSQEWQTLPDGTPICPRHHTPMRLRERQGDKWWSHNVGKGADGKDVYCKGYKGKDSPGYEVD